MSNITQYFIHEGLDVVGKARLLAKGELSFLVKPPNGVQMCICSNWYAQLLHDLYGNEVNFSSTIDNEL